MRSWPPLLLAGVAAWASCAGAALAEPRAQIRGELPDELRAQLVRAVGEVDGAPENRFEARRRARAAAESATALLRSEGFYQPLVEDVVEGDETPLAIITVTPGRRFVLTEPAIAWQPTAPDARSAELARAEIGLTAGDPGRAVDVIAGEGRAIAALVREGYADAEAQPRRVVVDHAAFTVAPEYRLAPGERVRLNGVRLETQGRTNPAWVRYLAPWREGDIYDPERVAELERRLLETGVFDGVGVALAPREQNTADGHRPVIVTLTDRPRRILDLGLTVSTAEGYGASALWTHFNRFGRADTLRYEARFGTLESRLGASLNLPHWRRPGRTLQLSGYLLQETTDAYDRTAVSVAADLRQRLGRTSWFSYGAALDAGRYDESRFDLQSRLQIVSNRDLAILTFRGSAYIDRSNDPLDPTSGWRLTINAQPTAVAGEDTTVFLRAESQATAYLPLQDGAKAVAAGRIRLGSIFGSSESTVPSDRLFFSGGGGSVRGYEYQGVAPRQPDGRPRGGLSLFEVSAEVRRQIRGNLGAAVFVDAGSVGFNATPDFSNLRYSAGFGVRYRLPFGPIRADIAFPLEKREGDADFQVYVSIGQAF